MYIYSHEIKTAKNQTDSDLLIKKSISHYLYVKGKSRLASKDDKGAAEPEIARTDRGKPYLPGLDIHLSVTHTGHIWLCAVSEDKIGIDSEYLKRDIDSVRCLKIARRYFTESEYRFIENSGENTVYNFLDIWTKKEAYAKYKGRSIFVEMSADNTIDKRAYDRVDLLEGYITNVYAPADNKGVEEWIKI